MLHIFFLWLGFSVNGPKVKMTAAPEVKDIGFRPGIVNLRKFEHRTGNSPTGRQGELIGLQWGISIFMEGFSKWAKEFCCAKRLDPSPIRFGLFEKRNRE
jgi:hypothetical protein